MRSFFLCFTLFLSAYLWAASYTLESGGLVSFHKANTQMAKFDILSAPVQDADCEKDIVLYCDYNTSYTSQDCKEKAASACSGNAAAMREISEASKAKSLHDLRKLGLI